MRRWSAATAQTCSCAPSGAAADVRMPRGIAPARSWLARCSAETPDCQRRIRSWRSASHTTPIRGRRTACEPGGLDPTALPQRLRDARNPSTQRITASVSGTAMAVSFESAAAVNHNAAAHRPAIAIRQRVHQSPEREGGGKDVGVRQRALRKPDRVKRRQHDRPEGDRRQSL